MRQGIGQTGVEQLCGREGDRRGAELLEFVWEGSEVVARTSAVGRAGSIYTKRCPDRLPRPDPRTLRDWPRQP